MVRGVTNVAPAELRAQLDGFVRWRRGYLSGDEKGEAQVFCDRLFQAFGHGGVREAGATLEMRLKKNDAKGTAFADLMWKPRCLIEMKRAGTDLSRHYRQAFDYWVAAVPDRPATCSCGTSTRFGSTTPTTSSTLRSSAFGSRTCRNAPRRSLSCYPKQPGRGSATTWSPSPGRPPPRSPCSSVRCTSAGWTGRSPSASSCSRLWA